MGVRKMATPTEFRNRERIELALCLPEDWPDLKSDDVEKGGTGPGARIITNLQELARIPFEYNTWLGDGHTIPNGDPAEPMTPGSRLVCALIDRPRRIANPDFRYMTLENGKPIAFLSVVFLAEEEMKYKLRHGMMKLRKKLDAGKVDELLRLRRKSACSWGIWQWLFG